MFKYYLMGTLYKDEYVINTFQYGDIYADEYIYPSYSNTYNYSEYNLENESIDTILTALKNERQYRCENINNGKYYKKYVDEQDYKDLHKIKEQEMLTRHIFDKYVEFDTVETDRELRDGEIIKIQDNSYRISYKFNKDLNRHELYIDYEIEIEIDGEIEKQCKDKLNQINNRINEYNKMIDKSEIVVDERFMNYVKPIEKSRFIKLKEWLIKDKFYENTKQII